MIGKAGTLLCAGALMIGVCPVRAANLAFDSAADPVYNDGWQSGDNGGYGLAPWGLLALGTSSGHFMSTSTGNGDGLDDGTTRGAANDRDIDTSGRSWGMYASYDANADGAGAFRSLTGGPLSIGQSILIDMDNGYIVASGLNTVGVQFLVSDGNAVFFRFKGGDTNYEVLTNNFTTIDTTTLGFADEGMTIALTRTGFATMSLTATLRNGDTDTIALIMTGSAGADVIGLSLNNDSAGPGSSHDAYFNSITVTPEPASAALLGIAGVFTFNRRLRSSS
ncbi:MAG: PEP-CTERM sorting domain-containing protein [Phycisphaerales bacterium]